MDGSNSEGGEIPAMTFVESQIQEIKSAATGRWTEILESAGIRLDVLDGKGHPCPKLCGSDLGGTDRFSAGKDFKETGAVFCRNCFNKESKIHPGDGIASVAWMLGMSNGRASQWIAKRLGLDLTSQASNNIVESTACNKCMPLEAFKLFGATPAQRGKKLVARVPVYNEHGEPFSYFDLAPGVKGWFQRGKGNSGLFFPGRLPVGGETWLLVEGVKDAAALVGLGFNAAGMPTCFLADKYSELFKGVNVVFVPDLDSAGQGGAQRSAKSLVGIAASIQVARLPGEIKKSDGDDVREVLKRVEGETLVRAAVSNATFWKPTNSGGDRPEVQLTLTEGAVAEEIVSLLGKLGWDSPWLPPQIQESCQLFVRNGVLVRPVVSEDLDTKGQSFILTVPPAILRERITQACQLYIESEKEGETEIQPVRPPKWLVDAIHQRTAYSSCIRPLTGIISSPTIRSDGTILQIPGYDDATGLIYKPNASFPLLPENPSIDDAKSAIELLLDVICDFPLQSDADRSAWVAYVLSLLGRTCVRGCVPMFVVTANTRASGKGKLADLASLIAFGRQSAKKPLTTQDEELRKTITTVVMEAIPSVLFDNIDVRLGGASLDLVLTSEIYSDRILGVSKSTGDVAMRTVWGATGNNVEFGSDVARRVLPIRLFTDLEYPELRSEFKHKDLVGWVVENRPELAIAALTILRAYFAAGCPEQANGTWGSFDNWSRIIRGALVWAGAADPLSTREFATGSDESKNLLRMLVAGLEEADPNGTGLTTKEIERLTSHRIDESPTCPILQEAVAQICGSRFNSRRFGKKLHSFKGRNIDGKKITSTATTGGVSRWTVKEVGKGFGGCSGYAAANYAGEIEMNFSIPKLDTYAYRNQGETDPLKPSNPLCSNDLSGLDRGVI